MNRDSKKQWWEQPTRSSYGRACLGLAAGLLLGGRLWSGCTSDEDEGGTAGDATVAEMTGGASDSIQETGGTGSGGAEGSGGASSGGTGGLVDSDSDGGQQAAPDTDGTGGQTVPTYTPERYVTASAAPSASPNAAGQTPAFEGQTQAAAPTTFSRVGLEVIASGLNHPWGVEVLPDGRFVVTEEGGNLRVILADGTKLDPLPGVPEVSTQGQGGLLDVTYDASDRTLCITYAESRGAGETATAAACTKASGTENLTLEPFEKVFQQQPAWASGLHYGSRFVFADDNTMYITTGERSVEAARGYAQDVTTTLGKVVRLQRDGSAPADNPFVNEGEVAAQVWSYGHRNLQSAALDAEGRLWTVEHGPQGGDELNRPEAGLNYGWPVITYGEDYSGAPIGSGITFQEGMEQPVYYWDPVIAPSGMAVYQGALFADWQGDILVGGLVARAVVHLTMNNDQVQTEERIVIGERVRDVAVGPFGEVYVVTDEDDGKLIRLTPG